MARETILVVEDEKDIVQLIRYNFQKEGYRGVSASDGEAGLAAARRHRPDLVVLDVMLPKMDGLETCRRLRAESQVPILFLTAKRSEVDRILGLKMGANDYVVKPFSVGELVARVQAILRRARPGAEPEAAPTRVGALDIDAERHEVRDREAKVNLAHLEIDEL